MNNNLLLIKYGELTTKKNNRNMFIKILKINIENKLKNYQIKLTYDHTRMFIEILDNTNTNTIIEKLKDIFGIHGIVICTKVENDIDLIKEEVLKQSINQTSFKIETKRSNKNFPYTSMEFNCLLGDYVLDNNEAIIVDIHNPNITITIEIRNDYTYIYSSVIKGNGGYPVSSIGKGLLMISGGIDSPVAGYLAQKRGIKLECIYFDSPPHTNIQALNKVKSLIKILSNYQGSIKLHVVNFTKIQEEIYHKCDNDYIVTLMRRMMYQISEKLARRNKLSILINGESLGQVASQTLSSINVINSVVTIPVIRPVACLDKLEIIKLSKKIKTYETSILPYEDCCTVFVPKHPVINPNIEKVIKSEALYNKEELIYEAIKNIQTYTINEIDDLSDLL